MSSNWIKNCGESDAGLEAELKSLVDGRIAAGDYSWDDKEYISKVDLKLIPKDLDVPDKTLERLRSLCQLYDVDIHIKNIASHRPIVGPIIVALKKLIYPMVKVLLKDFIRQQRAFNAGAISLLAELANQKAKEKQNS